MCPHGKPFPRNHTRTLRCCQCSCAAVALSVDTAATVVSLPQPPPLRVGWRAADVRGMCTCCRHWLFLDSLFSIIVFFSFSWVFDLVSCACRHADPTFVLLLHSLVLAGGGGTHAQPATRFSEACCADRSRERACAQNPLSFVCSGRLCSASLSCLVSIWSGRL